MLSKEDYNLTFAELKLSDDLKIGHIIRGPHGDEEIYSPDNHKYGIVNKLNSIKDYFRIGSKSKTKRKVANIRDFSFEQEIMIGVSTHVYFAKYMDIHDEYKYVVIKITKPEHMVLNGCYLQIKAFNSNVEGNNRIMPIYDIIEDNYDGVDVYAIVMPAGCNSLFQEVSGTNNDIQLLQKYITQVAEAIYCCHENSIVHRDIKSDNFIVMPDGNLRLIDFDFSNIADSKTQFDKIVGTIDYMSPEIVCTGINHYNRSCDLWAFGVLIYDICLDDLPFTEKTDEVFDVFSKIKNFRYEKIKNIDKLPDLFKPLTELLLRHEHEHRANINEILNILKYDCI